MTGDLGRETEADGALEDARHLGIDLSPEDLRAEPGAGVWPENVAAVKAFLAVATQWRFRPLGEGRSLATGLDYTAARAGLEMDGIKVTPDLWSKIRVIEAGAVVAMNEAMR